MSEPSEMNELSAFLELLLLELLLLELLLSGLLLSGLLLSELLLSELSEMLSVEVGVSVGSKAQKGYSESNLFHAKFLSVG